MSMFVCHISFPWIPVRLTNMFFALVSSWLRESCLTFRVEIVELHTLKTMLVFLAADRMSFWPSLKLNLRYWVCICLRLLYVSCCFVLWKQFILPLLRHLLTSRILLIFWLIHDSVDKLSFKAVHRHKILHDLVKSFFCNKLFQYFGVTRAVITPHFELGSNPWVLLRKESLLLICQEAYEEVSQINGVRYDSLHIKFWGLKVYQFLDLALPFVLSNATAQDE